MSASALALRYILFAVLATVLNLASQRVVLFVGDTFLPLPQGLSYVGALGVGTLTGLVLKYVLDKRWIFADRSTGIDEHGKRFSLYVLMGMITTVVFWGTETAFWLSFHTSVARELGGAVGLSIGYFIKYRLDRRFVFTSGVAGVGVV